MGRLDVRDPVADRLARRLLQRLRAEVDAAHLRAEQPHPLDVGTLAAHVLFAHVDDAVEARSARHRRGGDAVLAGAGLGDDPLLTEPPREHRLAERIVQLVRAGVEKVLALEVDPFPGCEALCERERRRAARVRRQQVVQLGAEEVVGERLAPAALQLVERQDQRLGDVAAAVGAEVAHCASWTNARTFSWSLIPGADSSCDAASTAHGWTASIAARTLSGPSRPASNRRSSSPARCASGRDPRLPRADRRPGQRARRRGAGRRRGRARCPPVARRAGRGRALFLGLADEDGDAEHRVRHRGEPRAPGAESPRRR